MNSPKNICLVGKHILSSDLSRNYLDFPLFLKFAEKFSKVILIYQHSGKGFLVKQYSNITAHLIPKLKSQLDLPHFWYHSAKICLQVNKKWPINVLSASEPFGAGVTGVILKYKIGLPFVLNIQGEVFAYPPQTHSMAKRKIARFISTKVAMAANGVRCVTKKIHRQALEAGIHPSKLFYSPSRCDIHRFDPAKRRAIREKLRETLGLRDSTVVFFLGAVTKDKGIWEYLESMALLCSEWDPVKGLVIGTGDAFHRAVEWTRQKGLEDKIVFCGRVPHVRVPDYISAGDICVYPSKHEAMPRAVLECMAMEKPVVCVSVGGLPEIVNQNETGLIVEKHDPEMIAGAVGTLLSSVRKRRRLGENARGFVSEQFEFHKRAEELVDFHMSVCLRSQTRK